MAVTIVKQFFNYKELIGIFVGVATILLMMNSQHGTMEDRLDSVESRVVSVEERIYDLNSRLGRIEGRLDISDDTVASTGE